jgi:hypothetical protein
MGYGLHVEFDHEVDDPPEYLSWSSKGMLDALAMGYEIFGFASILDLVAERLNVDVRPLHKVTNPEFTLDDFVMGIEADDQEELERWRQRYYAFDERRESTWQPPSALKASIEELIQGLDKHPQVFEEVGVDPDGYSNYFLSGVFRKELDDLLRIVSWAEHNGVRRLRLVWF